MSYGPGMLRAALVVIALTAGCNKADDAKPAPATLKTGTVAADGVRTIQIAATADGYQPERIPGKPGEKLVLVFTRKVDSSCLEQLKTPDGKLLDLPMNKPVEVAVTVPADGEVKFACGMDMFTGVVVAEKG